MSLTVHGQADTALKDHITVIALWHDENNDGSQNNKPQKRVYSKHSLGNACRQAGVTCSTQKRGRGDKAPVKQLARLTRMALRDCGMGLWCRAKRSRGGCMS